jgi:hypothetical protein
MRNVLNRTYGKGHAFLTPYDLSVPLAKYQGMLLAVVPVEDLPVQVEGSGVMKRYLLTGSDGRTCPKQHVGHNQSAVEPAFAHERCQPGERGCHPVQIANVLSIGTPLPFFDFFLTGSLTSAGGGGSVAARRIISVASG